MKKWLKLWLLASAIVAMSWSILLSTTNAATNTATVQINDWTNRCTWSDYTFTAFTVQSTAVSVSKTWKIECSLLNSASSWVVSLQIAANLTSTWWQNIPGSSFTVATTAWTTAWSLVNDTAESAWAFTSARTIYSKAATKAWTLKNIVATIAGTIPAWTPAWTYTGTLTLLYPGS